MGTKSTQIQYAGHFQQFDMQKDYISMVSCNEASFTSLFMILGVNEGQ